jgi:hypothetical protein
MDTVQKPISVDYHSPSSELFRFYKFLDFNASRERKITESAFGVSLLNTHKKKFPQSHVY